MEATLMVRQFALSIDLVVLLCISSLVGCGDSTDTAALSGSPEDAFFDEFLEQPQTSQGSAAADTADVGDSPRARLGPPRISPAVPSEEGGDGAIRQVAANTDVFRRPKGEQLRLNLKEGDRFPLIKTVRQDLVQDSETDPLRAETALQLTLAITVEEVAADSIRMRVHYSRVIYEHKINGDHLRYDSTKQQDQVPWDAIPYAGMVNNGFSFRLNPDNTIQELIDYREFLERCVEQVPLERRRTLLDELSSKFGDDGVANFIDESIGLLPYDGTVDADAASMVMQGDIWTRERRLMHPIPVYLKSTCTLTDIDSQSARIEITGRIASGEATTMDGSGMLRISGGRSMGHCIVDRASGLPTQVEVNRYLTIDVETGDGRTVTQKKTVQTSIRAFPEMAGTEGRN
jgi:hypothetical protein